MFKKNISGFAGKGLQNYSLFFDKPTAYRKKTSFLGEKRLQI